MSCPHRHVALVVDDDDGLRYALTRFLDVRGVDAVEAVSARAALDRLHTGCEPCVIVTDAVMPGLDGWALIDALRADPSLSAIPVVMISGHPAHVSRAVSLGVRTYLPKPLEPSVVADSIEQYCRHDH